MRRCFFAKSWRIGLEKSLRGAQYGRWAFREMVALLHLKAQSARHMENLRTAKLSDFKFDDENVNKVAPRGMDLLKKSLGQRKFARPMFVRAIAQHQILLK